MKGYTKRILGYTRDTKGKVVSRSVSDIANCVMGTRGGTTAVYVIEWNEETERTALNE